jgi:uncharacterized membrane protein YeaQ/YmgE (transglycosylase-associated protein family)
MGIIGFLIFGLIVGLIARALFPGRQAMGWIMTAVLGMVGSLVGGMVGNAIFGGSARADGTFGFSPGGWISSIVGALLVLWIYIALVGRRRRVV